MARTKGSKNKQTTALSEFVYMPSEERLKLIANLVIDRVIEDQKGDKHIERKLRVDHAIGTISTT